MVAFVQRTLGVERDVAIGLTRDLASDDCCLMQHGLEIWLADFISCWTDANFQVTCAAQVLQRQPGLRFVRVEAIRATLTWLTGEMDLEDGLKSSCSLCIGSLPAFLTAVLP